MDALSRTPATNRDVPVSSATADAETQINMVAASLSVSDVALQRIAQETAKDPLLQSVPLYPKWIVESKMSTVLLCVCRFVRDKYNTELSFHAPGHASAYSRGTSWRGKM